MPPPSPTSFFITVAIMETFCHYITPCVAMVLNIISHSLIRLITAYCRVICTHSHNQKTCCRFCLSLCRVCHDAFCTVTRDGRKAERQTLILDWSCDQGNDLKLNTTMGMWHSNTLTFRANPRCSFRTGNPGRVHVCIIVLVVSQS